MHILLINSNPVISRLLVLCTRDDALFLEEVSSMEDVKDAHYDLVFVDEESYVDGVKIFLERASETRKVFISFEALPVDGFDVSIKKPFLPSAIKDLIKSVQDAQIEREEKIEEAKPFIFPLSQDASESEKDVSTEKIPEEDSQLLGISESEENEETEKEHLIEKIIEEAALNDGVLQEEVKVFDEDSEEALSTEEEIVENQPLTVLNANEVEKIKALLEMDDTPETEEPLSEEELEARKIKVIKEQLIADGLEILEEDTMIESLSISQDPFSSKASSKKEKKKKKKSKNLKFTEKNMEHIEDAVEVVMASMTKKQMKKLLKGKEITISIKLEGKA